MKQREVGIPMRSHVRRTGTLERLVQLYEETNRKDESDQWRKELQQAKEARKPAAN
jgi:hypothetical protein